MGLRVSFESRRRVHDLAGCLLRGLIYCAVSGVPFESPDEVVFDGHVVYHLVPIAFSFW
jgi:hypothetical protein